MSNYIIENGTLYHYGILGQKWGIRRYQNEDGSLTDAGQKRYARLESKLERQKAKIEKYQKKLDTSSRRYMKGVKQAAKAARLKNKAYNSWLMSDRKRAKLKFKAERLDAKSKVNMNPALKNASKIVRAQALINKYDRKMSKLNPNHISKGKDYVANMVKYSHL